jgi:hypothetical protein
VRVGQIGLGRAEAVDFADVVGNVAVAAASVGAERTRTRESFAASTQMEWKRPRRISAASTTGDEIPIASTVPGY